MKTTLRTLTKSFCFSLVCVLLLLGGTGVCFAQNIGINTTGGVPNASAILDVDAAPANNKGVLIPRIPLTATNSNAPVGATIAISLLVYNTATAGVAPNNVSPGYYYWDGAKWARLLNTGNSTGLDWSLIGNTGTTAANFLGTTDNIPLNFRVNNQKAGKIAGDGSTFLGYLAGNVNTATTITGIGYGALSDNTSGDYNVALGTQALEANTTGTYNTALGSIALKKNTTGWYNTAIGYGTLFSNLTGNANVAIGFRALFSNTGSNNVAIGTNSLTDNTSGIGNVAIGNNALNANTTAGNNVAIGGSALFNNTIGINNNAVGTNALQSNTTGSKNTSLGENALSANTTGSNNTALGFSAYTIGTAFNNSTALGSFASVNASDKVRIGGPTVTVVEGQVAYSFPSDERFKDNVVEEVKGLDFINRLRPVVYNFDTRRFDAFLMKSMSDSLRDAIMKEKEYTKSTAVRQSGFIAQEVEQIAKEIGYDFNGVHHPENENDNYGISYSLFVVPLVKGMQEQQKMIEEMRKEINELKKP